MVTGTPERASSPPKYPPTAPAPTTATFGQFFSAVVLSLSCSRDSSDSEKVTSKVVAQFAERRQDHQLACARHNRLVLQLPGVHMRDVDRVQACLHRRVDVAARRSEEHTS